MTRHKFSSQEHRRTITTESCDGALAQPNFGQTDQVTTLGVMKSIVIEGDPERIKPTPFQVAWVAKQRVDHYTAVQLDKYCSNGGKPFYTKKYERIPFASDLRQIPTFMNFNGIGVAQLPAAIFNSQNVHNAVTMAILKKVGNSQLSLGVTAGEAKETMNLALDLVEDVLSCVKFVRTGIKDPKSFVNYILTKPAGRPALNSRPKWDAYAKQVDNYNLETYGRRRFRDGKFTKRELDYMGLTTSAAANRWLMLRYGATPAYNDMIKIFDHIITIPPEKLLYDARVTIPINAGVGSEGYYRSRSGGKVKSFQQCKLWYSIADHKIRKLAERGIDIASLPSIAWELTPFSFMVDWFYPVGNSLEALSATRGLKFEFGYLSQKYSAEDVITNWISTGIGGVKHIIDTSSHALSSYGAFQRTLVTSFPLVRFPVVENPFGVHTGQRITDVVTILHQLISGNKPQIYKGG